MTLKNVEDFYDLEGCTVIEGNLVIALDIINPTFDSIDCDTLPSLNISFPELREITDNLVIYQSLTLLSLTNVFPNLTVIRGDKLLDVSVSQLGQELSAIISFLSELCISYFQKSLPGGARPGQSGQDPPGRRSDYEQ